VSEIDWDTLQQLYEQAADLGAVERAAFLSGIATRDAALGKRLRAMLASDDSRANPLDRDIGQLAASLLGSDDAPAVIGPYRLLRLLGEGGMGVVWQVERTDTGGQAALKLLRDAWVSPSRRARFASEQRILARLSHPGIAQLHDAGTLPDGTPWFVMEFVDGVPITTHARERELDVESRLQLLRSVATAVQHAHAHAIIHRDLKPSNVLVNAAGDVKLLDFGISKQLDDSERSGELTVTGLRPLTPAYAAPEQYSGGPLGVATDIFAIGAIGYELLSGRKPFGSDTSGDPLADRIEEIENLPPLGRESAVAGRAAWDELDVMIRKAMHPDPARRYGTVESFIRDIDHYLAGEPLEARPDSFGYRAGRFVRRNSRVLAAATAVLLGAVTLSGYYTVRLAQARDAAIAEAERTQRIQSFVTALFDGGDDAAGPPDSLRVRDLIERGVNEAVALQGEPGVQAGLFVTLATLQRQLGHLDEADSLNSRALAIRRELHGDDHPDVAASLTELARLRIDQARLDEADTLLAAAVRIVDRHLSRTDARAIAAHAALGTLYLERADWPGAIARQEDVLARLASRGDAHLEEADAMVQLASSHFYAGNLETSDSLNRIALDIYRRLRGDNHPRVADVLINLGAAEFERGRYEGAEQYYREALRRFEAWHGESHPATASSLTMLGRALNFQGKDAEAAATLTRALAIQERHYGPDNPRVASALNDIAMIEMRRGEHASAESLWQRSEQIYLRIHGDRHWLLGVTRSNLGTLYTRMNRLGRAEQYFRDAIRLFTESQGSHHLNTGIARIKLGRTLLGMRRWRESIEESKAGLEILEALPEAPQGFIDAAREDLQAAYEAIGDEAALQELP
jgi:tetratricopeptide (TPR) repeat protein